MLYQGVDGVEGAGSGEVAGDREDGRADVRSEVDKDPANKDLSVRKRAGVVTKKTSDMWKGMSDEQKAQYNALAAKDEARYQREQAEYEKLLAEYHTLMREYEKTKKDTIE